ncbi:hypothetical protein KC19_VG285800 [Ceratodon purpureus]|uniref:TF-B3 domain-containing protein n=1 Tax=Ceratodon purpureus TaxID=3225 RepID=A0A8T0HVA7_CERPU|nr:hypothetical protein KC19_VG285800 [Ceratodon purpureus]
MTHTLLGKNTRLDIPTPYWWAQGEEKFNDVLYTLTGSMKWGIVKNALHMTTRQTFYFFIQGWYEFYSRNRFEQGDTLLFTKTGAAAFTVTPAIYRLSSPQICCCSNHVRGPSRTWRPVYSPG